VTSFVCLVKDFYKFGIKIMEDGQYTIAVLEAMASGLPVIAGNRTSIPEIVSDAGILLDPFDVEGFAYWMREVLMNEDLRNKLSEIGYKRSMNFSWEKCARETLEVYKEILSEA